MKERPILFRAPMVNAILEGRKTQTRRVLDWPTLHDSVCLDFEHDQVIGELGEHGEVLDVKMRYRPGDRLWVRETWRQCIRPHPTRRSAGAEGILYRADDSFRVQRAPGGYDKGYGGRWKPSIHMPRWASRITLEVTDVRVERLQDISEDDCDAEGVDRSHGGGEWGEESLIEDFMSLWNSINGPDAWEADPWVWVVGFERLSGGVS